MVGKGTTFGCLVVLVAVAWSGCLGVDESSGIDVPNASMAEQSQNETTNATESIFMETTMTWMAGVTGCGPARIPETDGDDHVVVPVGESWGSSMFHASLQAEIPAEQYKISFFDDNLYLESFRTSGTTIHGWVPPAATQALVSSCGGQGHSMTLVVGRDPAAAEPSQVIQHGTAHWRIGVPGCIGTYYSGTDGYDHGRFMLHDQAADQGFEARFEATGPVQMYGLSFFRDLEHLETFEAPQATIEGRVPTDATEVIAWTCGGASVDLDFTVLRE